MKFTKLWKFSGDHKKSKHNTAVTELSVKQCHIPDDNLKTPKQENKKLGSSIVLLSPNDAEIMNKIPSSTQISTAASVKSTRNNLVPIINNPRQQFRDADRKLMSNRKVETDKISRLSAHNKVTLV